MNSTTSLILFLAIVANGAAASLPSIIMDPSLSRMQEMALRETKIMVPGVPILITCRRPSKITIHKATPSKINFKP